MKVVGIGGSLAAQSSSLAALKIALEGAAEGGARTELFDVRALGLPMYSPEIKDVPEPVRRLCEGVHGAAGLLWSSPLYHWTISGSSETLLTGCSSCPTARLRS